MHLNNFNYFTLADGAQLRYGYWQPDYSINNSMTVVIFQGRASFIEKFENVIDGLMERGHHVWAFDWRGQGLSSRMLSDIRKGHIDSYNTYLSDVHAFMQGVVLPQRVGPCIVLGQSMGSHLALRYMLDHPHVFARAVLTAPLLDLNTGGYSTTMARVIAQLACRCGLGSSFVLGHETVNPLKEPFEGNMLTRNRHAFLQHRRLQKENPAMSIGGVTYQWVDATFNSIDYLMQEEKLSTITVPTLMIAAGEDVVVDNGRIEQAVSWLPHGLLRNYTTARHQILTETNDILDQFWSDFDDFVQPLTSKSTKGRFIKSPQLARMNALHTLAANDLQGLYANL